MEGGDPQAASPSATREHYENMISFHKWIVTMTLGALTLIISVALGVFWKDMSQVRSEAAAAVGAARDSATREISTVREEAANIALTEAQKRVDEAFKTTNVVSMVEAAAKRQVGPVIERQVNAEVDRVMTSLQGDISTMGQLVDIGMKMRVGLRDGLEGLAAQVKTSASENIRLRAKSLLDSITADYEKVELGILRDRKIQHALDALDLWGLGELKNQPSLVSGLVAVIHQDSRLDRVAFAFLALREASGHQFKMFDFEDVDRWCEMNKPRCESK
jgi:hypothetical protein